MAYKSVLWTAKTPITYDRLAQMQENINELRAMIEGNQTYIVGNPMGVGKGIIHIQEVTSNITVPFDGTWVTIGSPFTPTTQSGRRYLFEIFLPRVHSYSGSIAFEMMKGSETVQSFVVGPATTAELAYVVNLGGGGMSAGFFADSGYGAVHLIPGASDSTAYSVRATAYLNYTSGQIAGNNTTKTCIKFSDVGPSFA